MAEASGLRQTTCPWQALRDGFTAAVMRAYRWYRARQLETRWGGPIPEALARGLEVYDGALNATQVHDMQRDQEQRERESEERLAEMQHGPRPDRPLHLRR